MYTVSLHKFIRKLHLRKTTIKIPTLWNLQGFFKRNFVSASKPKVGNDIVLYRLEKPKYFFYLKLLSGINCLFWVSSGIQGLQSFKDIEGIRDRIPWGDSFVTKLYSSNLIGSFAVLFGITITAIINLYVLRSVRKVILHRGERSITLMTYSVLGMKNEFKIPISKVSAVEFKRTEKGYFPLKVKNKYLYFLVDNEGEFADEALFNRILGIRRNLG